LIISRPCRTNDVEQEKKPVTTYTIEGAYVNKHPSLIGVTYEINENDANNTGPLTDTSYITLHEASLYTEPLADKSLLTMDNDHNLFRPVTPRNVPVTFDTTSVDSDRYKMMMHRDPFPLSSSIFENAQAVSNPTGNNIYGIQKLRSYERHPPPQLSATMDTSNVPATIRSNIYEDNIQQPINPLHFKSLSQSMSSSNPNLRLNDDLPESNIRQALRPWTKHPRWVLRLSQAKQIHTPPLTSHHPLSRERPTNYSSSSGRSTTTIPRYAFAEE
jgi:hypothetical protein